jgi:hypothetical protein
VALWLVLESRGSRRPHQDLRRGPVSRLQAVALSQQRIGVYRDPIKGIQLCDSVEPTGRRAPVGGFRLLRQSAVAGG